MTKIRKGESSVGNIRKPGGGRKKLKPEYDAGKNLKEQMDAAVALYGEDCSLQSIADDLTLNPIKVRKLLITASVYESEVAEKVQDTFEEYRETQNYKEAILSTANILKLSRASVTSYLPYQKGVYFPSIIKKLAKELTAEYGKGYTKTNLYHFYSFYKTYPEIFHSASGKLLLSWTHYRTLLQVNDKDARDWYEKEALEQTWSVATLQRNISSQYYYRILQTQRQDLVENEMKELTAGYQNDKYEFTGRV